MRTSSIGFTRTLGMSLYDCLHFRDKRLQCTEEMRKLPKARVRISLSTLKSDFRIQEVKQTSVPCHSSVWGTHLFHLLLQFLNQTKDQNTKIKVLLLLSQIMKETEQKSISLKLSKTTLIQANFSGLYSLNLWNRDRKASALEGCHWCEFMWCEMSTTMPGIYTS